MRRPINAPFAARHAQTCLLPQLGNFFDKLAGNVEDAEGSSDHALETAVYHHGRFRADNRLAQRGEGVV